MLLKGKEFKMLDLVEILQVKSFFLRHLFVVAQLWHHTKVTGHLQCWTWINNNYDDVGTKPTSGYQIVHTVMSVGLCGYLRLNLEEKQLGNFQNSPKSVLSIEPEVFHIHWSLY